MPLLRKRPLLALIAAALIGSAAVSVALAQQAPGPPDYYWPYGTVQLNAANVLPEQQDILGMVNGKVCGIGETLVASAGENVPASDVGKTVYRVDILADGIRPDEKPGCGKAGNTVVLYLPLLHRIAQQTPAFKSGGERVDIDLSTDLQYHAINPYAARDGAQ